jgi:hypothetical protein
MPADDGDRARVSKASPDWCGQPESAAINQRLVRLWLARCVEIAEHSLQEAHGIGQPLRSGRVHERRDAVGGSEPDPCSLMVVGL